MADQERWMRLAIELATDNVLTGRGGPFGAVLVRDGALLATGVNQVTLTDDPTAHAEIVAIREACRLVGHFELRGATLYSSCEPCPMCLAGALWARLDALFFGATAEDAAAAGFDDARFYQQLRLPVAERELASNGLLRDEAAQPFNSWRAAADRIDY